MTSNLVATDYPAVADRYLAAWNESDPASRRQAIAAAFAADAHYVDPMADVRGAAELDATIAAVQAQFPGFRFRLTGAVDGHHQQLRFSWELGPDGAPAPIAGSDAALLDADGRITTVLGFLDRVPGA
jgi:hypothetical protein